eukprot:SAG31_NODE_37562_length_303_cov_0.759804_1_plen_72_part_01
MAAAADANMAIKIIQGTDGNEIPPGWVELAAELEAEVQMPPQAVTACRDAQRWLCRAQASVSFASDEIKQQR